jgi:hypothetical protein
VPSATAASTAIIDLRISTFSVVLDASQRRLQQMVAARAIEQMARCYSFLNFPQQGMQ